MPNDIIQHISLDGVTYDIVGNDPNAVQDVEINGTSVVSSNTANIITGFSMTYDHDDADDNSVYVLDNGATLLDIYNASLINPNICLYKIYDGMPEDIYLANAISRTGANFYFTFTRIGGSIYDLYTAGTSGIATDN